MMRLLGAIHTSATLTGARREYLCSGRDWSSTEVFKDHLNLYSPFQGLQKIQKDEAVEAHSRDPKDTSYFPGIASYLGKALSEPETATSKADHNIFI